MKAARIAAPAVALGLIAAIAGPLAVGRVVAHGTAAAHPAAHGLQSLQAGAGRQGRHASDHQIPLPGAHRVTLPPVCKGYRTYGVPRVTPVQKNRTYTATFATNKGTFIVTLLPQAAPIAVESFIFLAQHHYFDGVKFHRVVPGFVIQGGDPTSTGYCGPGYEFKDEPVHQPYVRGTLAMANAGPNTNGSQFFIVLSNSTGLPPSYTIFGKVAHGMSAVDRIASVPLGVNSATNEKSVPLVKVYMKTVRITVR